MKNITWTILSIVLIGCSINNNQNVKQAEIKNLELRNYSFLAEMYGDNYFPNFLVDKGKAILIEMCIEIEKEKPKTLQELYEITHGSTIRFNVLQNEFEENGSEIETAARDCIGVDFENIAIAYGFSPDIEELISPRDW